MSNLPVTNTDRVTNQDRVETLGTGMARRAGNTVSAYPEYMRYVTDAQVRGESPLSYDAWVRQTYQQGVAQ